MSKPIFRALAAFGIGSETTNGADGLMVYGADDPKLKDAFAASASTRSMVQRSLPGGAAALLGGRGGREARGRSRRVSGAVGVAAAPALLHVARRRAGLSALGHDRVSVRGDYLEMMAALRRKAHRRALRARLVRGLNRVMTGLLIENTDKIFVASSGGFTQSRISVLCDTEVARVQDGRRRDEGRLDLCPDGARSRRGHR